jgi:hypothetical protein
MRIRVRDHVKLQPDRMAKVALAATERALLDLYCVAPGQAQKPHTHGEQDKIYYVLEGRGADARGGGRDRGAGGPRARSRQRRHGTAPRARRRGAAAAARVR